MTSESYRTLGEEARFEGDRVRGSRFIATAAPIQSEQDAAELCSRVEDEFPRARHHCFAWRMGPDGRRVRTSDAGEPGGTAGRPILQQIEVRELTQVVVVVTRYFGGTLLGPGGLARAYGGAAGAVLDRARVRVVPLTERVNVAFPYPCSGAVEAYLAQRGLRPARSSYDEEAELCFDVPVSEVETFLRGLIDCTAGRARRIPPGAGF